MVLKKNDFVEIEFTGRVKDTNEIFDSNVKKDLESSNIKSNPKPFVFSLGQGMFLESIDEFLIGKETGKYNIDLAPEKAFGNRDTKLVKIVPIKIFRQHNINPAPGVMFNFDGKIAKVLSVSGGRVIVDFNNPIAGKEVVYDINVLRKVEDMSEKINSFMSFLFMKEFDFSIEGKDLVIKAEKDFVKFIEAFKEKFNEIFNLNLVVKEAKYSKKPTEKKDKQESQ